MHEIMSAEEVAEYLNLNVKKIYQLANDGLIPAARVGGKWIFLRSLLEEWLYDTARRNLRRDQCVNDKVLVAIGSNDFAWDILAREMIKTPYHFITPYASVGSIEGLQAVGHRIAHLAGVHLLDPVTEDYNISYVAHYLTGFEVSIVNLFYRKQGIIVRKGNPKDISGMTDLARDDVAIVNRQAGSGTRVLMDTLIARNNISVSSIKGYDRVVNTHLELAIMIHKGDADAGIGIEAAARTVDLDFIPLKEERYDMVILRENLSLRPVQTLLEIVRSRHFQGLLSGLDGYDIRDAGKVIWEGLVNPEQNMIQQ